MLASNNKNTPEDITDLVLNFLDAATQDPNRWLDYLHDDFVVEFPYGESAGLPGQVVGKILVGQATSSFLDSVPGIRFNNPTVFPCIDPHLAFATYEVNVMVPSTGKEYAQTYISKFEIKDGKVIKMTEYYDPSKFTAAFDK